MHGFAFQREKKYLQAFYTFEIKLSLIVLVFFDTNKNTAVDVLAKNYLFYNTIFQQVLTDQYSSESEQRPYNI